MANPVVSNPSLPLPANRSVTQFVSPAVSLPGGVTIPTPIPAVRSAMSGYSPSGRAIAPGVKSQISSAIAQIAAALPKIQTVGQTDADFQQFLMGRLVVPFNTLNDSMADIFQPSANDIPGADQTSTVPSVQQAANNLISLMSGCTMQLPQTGAQPVNYPLVALQTTFVNGDTNDTNLTALVCYATEENLPAVEEETTLLQSMHQLVLSTIEASSELPAAFIPQVPNTMVLNNLQAAQTEVAKVQAELVNYGTFNRTGLVGAADSLAAAADVLQTGILTRADLQSIQAQYGLTSVQAAALAGTQFTPDPNICGYLSQLQAQNNQVQTLDANIVALHTNLLSAADTIQNTQQLGIGAVLGQVISVFQGQLAALINSLSARQPASLASILNSLQVGGNVTYQTNNNPANYTGLINQFSLYTQITALSYLFQQANNLASNSQKISHAKTSVMRVLLNFLDKYVSATEALNSYAPLIDQDVTGFINAVQNRIAGNKATNEVLAAAGYKLIADIENQLNFIWTLEDALVSNEQMLIQQMEGVANGIPLNYMSDVGSVRATRKFGQGDSVISPSTAITASGSNSALPGAMNNIIQLNSSFPQLQQTLRTLDLNNVFGTDKVELTGLDSLMNGLQQIVSYCPNSGTAAMVQQIQGQFSAALGNRLSKATVMSSFDEIPAQALSAAVQTRLDAVNNAISALQTLVNSNVLQVATQTPATLQITNSVAENIVPQVTGAVAVAQQEAAALAEDANSTAPFSS